MIDQPDLGKTYYNIKAQVRALEALLRKLPDPTTYIVSRRPRRMPKRVKRLSPEQVQELIKGYRACETVYELGDRFGISRQLVAETLKRHGVKMRRQGLSPEQVDEAVRLYRAGNSLARIGERLGADSTTVLNRLRERGVRMRDTHGRERT